MPEKPPFRSIVARLLQASGAILFLLGGIALVGAVVNRSWYDAAVSASVFLAGFLYLGLSEICTAIRATAENTKAMTAILDRMERATGTMVTELHNADDLAKMVHEAHNETNRALQWMVDTLDEVATPPVDGETSVQDNAERR